LDKCAGQSSTDLITTPSWNDLSPHLSRVEAIQCVLKFSLLVFKEYIQWLSLPSNCYYLVTVIT
jgi:hypothetical protein